ncbi:hypothetical protein RRG08_025950 [Elysia crispata]|uniref:Uncharacterized protein n=1 Tax=Elysia crispata TaxID=231223 RepID=A0AAE1DFI8_9GAST|nr:hypothetical protein RRG08_025950 [Elysia crispata]
MIWLLKACEFLDVSLLLSLVKYCLLLSSSAHVQTFTVTYVMVSGGSFSVHQSSEDLNRPLDRIRHVHSQGSNYRGSPGVLTRGGHTRTRMSRGQFHFRFVLDSGME